MTTTTPAAARVSAAIRNDPEPKPVAWAVAVIASKEGQAGYLMRLSNASSEDEAIGQSMRAFRELRPECDISNPSALPIYATLSSAGMVSVEEAEALAGAMREAAASESAKVRVHRDTIAGMRAVLRAGCDLLSAEVDALKAGISIGDKMQPGPKDQHTVEAIREIEDWIATAGTFLISKAQLKGEV